jgi:hypothetical protein
MAIEEDDLFMKALERLGRKVHRASIEDKAFDWHAGKSVVIRSAWSKVRLKDANANEAEMRKEDYFLTTHTLPHALISYYSIVTWIITYDSLTRLIRILFSSISHNLFVGRQTKSST